MATRNISLHLHSLCILRWATPGSYRRFTPQEKGDRHCKDKVNLDDVTKPKRCLSFRCPSAPSEELCYPALSPGSAQRLPATGNQRFQPGISAPFASPLSIPLHRCRALRIQHPTAPPCPTHTDAVQHPTALPIPELCSRQRKAQFAHVC